MKKIILIIFIIINFFILSKSYADIDLIVSPIKYEIEVDPWTTIEKSAKIINKSSSTLKINTSSSDFESESSSGNPKFTRKSELTNPEQELSSWIDIEVDSFIILPWEEKDISFSITIPENATPGWHYGAVFFKNNWGENYTNDWNIKINVDYWILLLINVTWEIISVWTPWEASINSSWWKSWYQYQKENKIDSCKIIDLTDSNIDGKCIELFWFENKINDLIKNIKWEELIDKNNEEIVIEIPNDNINKINDILENNDNEKNIEIQNDFKIDFEIPFDNKWNTHIKPEWKIILIDEDWNEIKAIWKEIIKNDGWTIIGEKIVDYIPINDIWGNVLPNTQRIFESEWKWFPYEAYDSSGKIIIKYWTPWEYYSMKNIEDKTFIYPWERTTEKLEQKNIKAIIKLWYKNYDWEDIEFNSAKEFQVDYKSNSVWLNPYFFILLFTGIIFIYITILIIGKKTRKRCNKCEEKIKKKMIVCPYCGTKQKTTKKKKK